MTVPKTAPKTPLLLKQARQLVTALEDGDLVVRHTSDGLIYGRVDYDQEIVHWESAPGRDEEEAFLAFVHNEFGGLFQSKHEGGYVMIYRKMGREHDLANTVIFDLQKKG